MARLFLPTDLTTDERALLATTNDQVNRDPANRHLTDAQRRNRAEEVTAELIRADRANRRDQTAKSGDDRPEEGPAVAGIRKRLGELRAEMSVDANRWMEEVEETQAETATAEAPSAAQARRADLEQHLRRLRRRR